MTTTLPVADLLAQVQARLVAVASQCQHDRSGIDLIDGLVHRLMNVHDHALVTQQAYALLDSLTPAQVKARRLARHTIAVTNRALFHACLDAAAVALHVASHIELEASS